MAGMTKSALLAALAEKTGMSKKDVASFMDAVVDMAYKEVKKSGVFVVPGIGKLVKVNRAARQGRNPATGATIQFRPRPWLNSASPRPRKKQCSNRDFKKNPP